MGGHAFDAHTPRIPTSIYMRVLARIETQLGALFEKVTHAIDAPEKEDHGDIDILALPFPEGRPDNEKIARALAAKDLRATSNPNADIYTLVSWPEDDFTSDSGKTVQENYIQVDITFCASEEELKWRLFAHSHADLVNILGSSIRHKGLTLTTHAFYLRIPDLDTTNTKITRIELSRDPDQVLAFLGLDTGRFWSSFATKDDMMAYIATCRFFDPARLHEISEEKRVELTKASLNARDKSQMENRPLFRYWYDVFLPAHVHDTPQTAAHLTRDEVRAVVFEFFGDTMKQKYEDQEKEVRSMLAHHKLWSNIKSEIALNRPELSEKELHAIMRAVRREVIPATSVNPSNPISIGLHNAYLTSDWHTVHDWSVNNYNAALRRWEEHIELNRQLAKEAKVRALQGNQIRSNVYSTSEVEIFTQEDDEIIISMKKDDKASWTDILARLGKKSKSQLQAHWKKNLVPRVEEEQATDQDHLPS